jgi:GNAT superfamily N-acetyltransferase
MDNSTIRLEIASEANIPLILKFIKDLAEYEQLLDNIQVTEDRLRHNLFGPRSFAEAVIAFQNDEPVAFALYFFTFSTFRGLPGLYVEDIFVRPAFRRSGIGRQLFAFLSNKARESGCPRIELSVLNWNEEAIRFYKSLGAKPVQGWTVFRLSNDAIEKLAARCS